MDKKIAPKSGSKTSTTRVFKSGNSQAVRIPAELAFERNDMEVTVTRRGDELVIAPKRPSMKETIAALQALPDVPSLPPMDRIELPDRDWK
jgi:Virulence-associated protein and related proteins